MGNIGSQTGQITHQQPQTEEQWAHSFPRTQARTHHHQHKVLPERDVHQKLRQTNNGEILQSGGTLSCKPNKLSLPDHNSLEKPTRTYLPNQRDPLHKSGNRYTQAMNYKNLNKENLKKFGSEPDLREKGEDCSRTKKKYKAPPPPPPNAETHSMDWDNMPNNQRARLFKTRAETKKVFSSPVNNRLSLPEINFHQELKEVTKRLRHTRASTEVTEINNRNKLKTLDIHKSNIKERLKTVEEKPRDNVLPAASPRIKEHPKTFYFGMDDDLVDHFASNLQSVAHIQKIANSSGSDISSEIDVDEHQSGIRNGIDLQLRPILPKKQLAIPRFSPAAAWRLLSVGTDPTGSTIGSDEIPIFIEEKIEKFARLPPPTIQGQRSNNDKSGDSGISGGYDDCPEGIMNSRTSLMIPSRNPGVSWTPQQDLGDDSSIEEVVNNDETYKLQQTKYTINKPHVFSLSLPRDNQLSNYMSDRSYATSLQKLKRSVSGVLGTLGNKKDLLLTSQEQSDNWFLSKSAPNSLNNGFNSLELKSNPKAEAEKDQFKSAGRLMYLPEFDTNEHLSQVRKKERSKSAERFRTNLKLSNLSKSCENIGCADGKSSSEPEDLQDPPKNLEEIKNWGKKAKRFTFQSTVRQIERKRLAERLSKEAEKKEKQRIRELEAMQRVEEEFQKKRAREKANIRQQLRLFSMDDIAWSSLPPNLDLEVRAEPDGAVSSSNASSPKKVYQKNKRFKQRPSSDSGEDTRIKAPVTQVLSEYRHPQREYKEYTGSTRHFSENNMKTTVHPQVTCNMPKAKHGGNKSGANYRKDFAHGVKSTRSAGSSYSEDSQSRNNSPRMYHNKYAPITR